VSRECNKGIYIITDTVTTQWYHHHHYHHHHHHHHHQAWEVTHQHRGWPTEQTASELLHCLLAHLYRHLALRLALQVAVHALI